MCRKLPCYTLFPYTTLFRSESIDLIIADPPYSLGKDYGNESDKLKAGDYLQWMENWIDAVLPKLKPNGSLYIFLTWRYSPEILDRKSTRLNSSHPSISYAVF